jgi:hypothetical protein
MSDNKQNNKKTKTLETYFVRSADVEQQDKVEADDVKTTSKLISFYRAGKLVLLVPVSKISRVAEKSVEEQKIKVQKVDITDVINYLASKGIKAPSIEMEANRAITN